MSITVIEKPSIYLVGRQQINQPELDRFLQDQGVPGFQSDASNAGEMLIEIAGRLCYESFKAPRPGGNEKYIGHIVEVGHGSVVEHEVFNFIITGVSRSLTHELVRHRAGYAFSQLSQRYVDESDVAFVVPPALLDYYREEPLWASGKLPWKSGYYVIQGWSNLVRDCLFTYKRIADQLEVDGATRKQAREAARSVLPNCTETKIFVTANARALRHFVELRGSAQADAEIRRLSLALLGVLKRESPHVFADIQVAMQDGVEIVSTPYRKI